MKNFKFDIRNKTLFSTIISAIILCFIFIGIRAYSVYMANVRDYTSTVKSQEINSAKNASLLVSEMLSPSKVLLCTTADQLKFKDINNDSEITDFLIEKGLKFTGIEGMYFGREKDGKFFVSRHYDLPDNFNPKVRPWYIEASTKKEFVITDPYIDVSTGSECLGLAVPVYQNGVLVGVLGADLPLKSINDMLGAMESEQKIHYSILTASGTAIILPKYQNMFSYINTIVNRDINTINQNGSGEIHIKNNYSQIYAYYLNVYSFNLKILSLVDPVDYSSKLNSILKNILLNTGVQFLVLAIFGISIIALFNFMKQRELHRLLYKDVLTGLNNRNYLELAFLNMADRYSGKPNHGLLLIDIDNFKFINDTLGHETGDFVLISIVSMLKRAVSKDSLITRIGSDEFAILIKNTSKEQARETAQKIQKYIFDTPVVKGGSQIDISISIGLTVIDSFDFELQKYMSLADVALRMAKDDGKNRVICLMQDDISADIEQMEKSNKTIGVLKNALKYDRFALYLQPIIELDSGSVSHYEALIRLKDEDGNFISPGDFIPIAEKFGLISEIDKWVFKTVINILKEAPDIKIFINLSAISLTDDSLLEYMAENMQILGADKSDFRLGIEITETAAAKNFTISENWINKFKTMGCLIAIDDFGVGYTSFSYLRSLPVDYIKIDGSLIKNIDSDKDFEAIVQAISTMGRVLGKKVIAEFVENESVLIILKEMGIYYGQGFFLGLPSPVKEYI